MIRPIKKTHGGLGEARDYDVKECIGNNESLILVYKEKGQQMTLTPEQLKTECKHKQDMVSIHNKPFQLWGYVWKPDKLTIVPKDEYKF